MRVHDYLEYHARETPDAIFARFEGAVMSYGEAAARARQIAAMLIDAGFGKGDRLGMLSQNCLEYSLIYYGCFMAGVVIVPLNYRLAGPEWVYILNDAGVKGVVARGPLAGALDVVRGDLPGVTHWFAMEADVPNWQDYTKQVDAAPAVAQAPAIAESDEVYIMYTSGTTGHPKGAVLAHSAVTANLVQWATAISVQPGAGFLIVAPMYHAAAGVSVFATVAQAGTQVIHGEFSPFDVVEALDDGTVNAGTLVPAMIQACLTMVPDVATRKYESLELIAYGASPISETSLRSAIEAFGCRFVQGYGMTETTAVLTVMNWAAHQRALAGEGHLLLSAGTPVLGTQLRIVDENDNEVPRGEVGEVAALGPQLMSGYLNKPEATAEALRGGWMHTGDAGIMDEEGFLFIQDRVKDMVVSGGENVYPREVEEVVFKHPAVADAAVIGVPDEKWGEALKAIVVLRDGATLLEEELITFCREYLAGFKIPRSMDLIDELPRNPSGKVLKRELREPYWKDQTRRVG